ncbi:hypothetical protein AVEN_234823-1 [Araneus ventricosus]|uniref:MADF domain-containing protein n=1 Tax=Araneus ventricosus TaxID=182803 RepID=A0A4Y2F4K4_ARAVE|nr:hypothetical protein AVEN_234823-1 [Araneus ventricosus]
MALAPLNPNQPTNQSIVIMEWTEINLLKLIEVYRRKPLLWHPKHKELYRKNLNEGFPDRNSSVLKKHEGYWDRPRNVKPRSDCKDDKKEVPSPNFYTSPAGVRLATTYDSACNRQGGPSVESGFEVGVLGPKA